jgi:hypothetical protein
MTDRKFDTDEDGMIHRLLVHRDMIGWVIRQLAEEGIQCQRTDGNDRNGDILIINEQDTSRVKQIIRDYQNKYNS